MEKASQRSPEHTVYSFPAGHITASPGRSYFYRILSMMMLLTIGNESTRLKLYNHLPTGYILLLPKLPVIPEASRFNL